MTNLTPHSSDRIGPTRPQLAPTRPLLAQPATTQTLPPVQSPTVPTNQDTKTQRKHRTPFKRWEKITLIICLSIDGLIIATLIAAYYLSDWYISVTNS